MTSDEAERRYGRTSGSMDILDRVVGWNCWTSITSDGHGLGGRGRVMNGKSMIISRSLVCNCEHYNYMVPLARTESEEAVSLGYLFSSGMLRSKGLWEARVGMSSREVETHVLRDRSELAMVSTSVQRCQPKPWL